MAGADEISGIGEMEAGVMGSYAQMVIDNELAESIYRIKKGIASDPEVFEVIAGAMASTRNFLSQKHTLKWLHSKEVTITKLAERGSWDSWIDSGKTSILERAQAEAARILREHEVPPLDQAQEKELDQILCAADREIQ
jgi:trimethylamine---corrinoid protein Co-methyltransferase